MFICKLITTVNFMKCLKFFYLLVIAITVTIYCFSNNNTRIIVNETKYVKIPKRKAVLILNSHMALRQSDKNKKSKKTTSLLYQEFDDQGKNLNKHEMYNLDDVVVFFKSFLDTEICYEECEST